MKMPLRLKFAGAFVVIAVLGFVFVYFFSARIVSRQAQNNVLSDLYKDATYLGAAYRVNTGSVNQGQLEALAYASGSDIWILDLSGTIVARSGTSQTPEAVSNFNPAAGQKGYYMIGNFFGCFDEEMISVYYPLTQGVMTNGYVVLHYPLKTTRLDADRRLLAAYIIYGALMAFLLLFFIFIELSIIRRLKKVHTAAHEYANGNLSYPSDVGGNDEITRIAETQAELAHQLNSSSEDQHRFLANISHDFRSPLTSIRGYIAAMQDGTIPPEMQGKYFDVVLNETDRLTKLANGLIDMTQLENGIILDRTHFCINDLIREVLPTFEGPVTDKGLSFDLTFEEEHAVVIADRARIQQVLYNLIDNAIKFSNTDSTVDISTHLHGDKIFVSVTDHGVGIEKENINKIWERFYKTDTSRGRDKKGTGLGLSIVREIIQAHKENIDVISTPGVGTEFIFTLPRE
ncbi:MAG: HAMP domain-containing histidine kinase [Lachnospiraceae bacterium]|nr:HAMP domain-containing histidine kinase [Lachnospiraceae bacterium]